MTDKSSDSIDEMSQRERREARQEHREARREERQEERQERRDERIDAADGRVDMTGADEVIPAAVASRIGLDGVDGWKLGQVDGPDGWKVGQVDGPDGWKLDQVDGPDGWKLDQVDGPDGWKLEDAVTAGRDGGSTTPGAGPTTTGPQWDNLTDDIAGRPGAELPNSLSNRDFGTEFIDEGDGSLPPYKGTGAEFMPVDVEATTTGVEWDDLTDDIAGRPGAELPNSLGNNDYGVVVDQGVAEELIEGEEPADVEGLDTAESFEGGEVAAIDVAASAIPAPADLDWQKLSDPLDGVPIDFSAPVEDFNADPPLDVHDDAGVDALLGDEGGFDVDG